MATGLAKLSLALRYQSWKEALGSGLTPTQGQVLSWLLLQPDAQRRTPGHLARALALSPATISETLNALERKGLICRRPLSRDRRSVGVDLTEEGRLAAQATAGWSDFLAAAVDVLPISDQVALLRVLIRLIRHLQVQGKVPGARMCVSCRYFRPFVHQDTKRPHHCLYVDAPLGDGDLQLECPDHESAEALSQGASRPRRAPTGG